MIITKSWVGVTGTNTCKRKMALKTCYTMVFVPVNWTWWYNFKGHLLTCMWKFNLKVMIFNKGLWKLCCTHSSQFCICNSTTCCPVWKYLDEKNSEGSQLEIFWNPIISKIGHHLPVDLLLIELFWQFQINYHLYNYICNCLLILCLFDSLVQRMVNRLFSQVLSFNKEL